MQIPQSFGSPEIAERTNSIKESSNGKGEFRKEVVDLVGIGLATW